MLESHYIARAKPSNDGYTWTLVTRMGAMLYEIEGLYGPRDMTWTPLGVEFGPGAPQIWYPGSCTNVAIQLAMNARWDEVLACYQLAHECVHLLAPTGGAVATVLEEGLATVFSEDYIERHFNRKIVSDVVEYSAAAAKVRQLLGVYPNAIAALRTVQPSFNHMTVETFVDAGLNVPEESVVELLTPFSRSMPRA